MAHSPNAAKAGLFGDPFPIAGMENRTPLPGRNCLLLDHSNEVGVPHESAIPNDSNGPFHRLAFPSTEDLKHIWKLAPARAKTGNLLAMASLPVSRCSTC
jgi:hypothetical protein